MPTYNYTCKGGHWWEDFNSVKERGNSTCPKCKAKGNLRIATPFIVRPSNYEYFDEHLDTWVHSPKHRDAVMKSQGLFCYADRGLKAQAKWKPGRKMYFFPTGRAVSGWAA